MTLIIPVNEVLEILKAHAAKVCNIEDATHLTVENDYAIMEDVRVCMDKGGQ